MYYAFSVPHDNLTLTLCSPVEILPKYPNMEDSFSVIAVWDTGSTFMAINPTIADRCGLWPVRNATANGLGGQQSGFWLNLPFRLSNGLLFSDKRTMACDLPFGIQMVIGMDIIITGDFHISHSGGKSLFSFIHPSLPTPVNLETEADRLNKQSL
jgi:hypothetical protein